MPAPNMPLSVTILAIMYLGDVVFAISGALTAARYRMDVLGFVLIGTITGIAKEEGALFQTAELTPEVDVNRVEEVLVIQSPQGRSATVEEKTDSTAKSRP